MAGNPESCSALSLVKPFDAGASERKAYADVPALMRDAIDGLGLKCEGVAGDIGYKGDYFSRVLVAERGITLDRLGCLPLDLQRDFVEAWARALGMRLERADKRAQQQALAALAAACAALAEASQ